MRGFSTAKPWRCRIYRCGQLFASLTIAAQDGAPITRKNATTTAILITSLLQEPTNTGCQCRLAHRLGDDAAQALMALSRELGDDFKVVMISPENVAIAEGYSQVAASRETFRERRSMRVVNPQKLA